MTHDLRIERVVGADVRRHLDAVAALRIAVFRDWPYLYDGDAAYEREQTKARVRGAIASLPKREQKVIALYYYAEATMKQIGAEIGVNESRVSQLHARAIRRLREALGTSVPQAEALQAMRSAILEFHKPKMAKAMAS